MRYAFVACRKFLLQDLELEAMYRDQVRSFTDYQTRVALRAISQNPGADLVMTYFEQPDGSGHQFLLIDPTLVRAVTSGPAANIYISLAGREPDGTVSQSEYLVLQQQVVEILKNFFDTNPLYTLGAAKWPVFDKVYTRPAELSDPDFGKSTNVFIGQDSGDVLALLSSGYNFDGTQNPVVIRQGDPASTIPILSVANFYGAHGYDPLLSSMSAIFYAAGPDVGQGTLPRVRNIDIAPTIAQLLGVPPALTVQGRSIDLTPRRQPHSWVR